jgi:glycyl-tRNA synthetase
MLDGTLLKIQHEVKNVVHEKFIPHAVEPAIGISRVLYMVLHHCFHVRAASDSKTYFSFPLHIAPILCYIFPIQPNDSALVALAHVIRTKSYFHAL